MSHRGRRCSCPGSAVSAHDPRTKILMALLLPLLEIKYCLPLSGKFYCVHKSSFLFLWRLPESHDHRANEKKLSRRQLGKVMKILAESDRPGLRYRRHSKKTKKAKKEETTLSSSWLSLRVIASVESALKTSYYDIDSFFKKYVDVTISM